MGWCCPCFLFGRTQSRLRGVRDPDLFSVNADVSWPILLVAINIANQGILHFSALYGAVSTQSVAFMAYIRRSSVSTCANASASKEPPLWTASHHAAARAAVSYRKRRSHCSNRRQLTRRPVSTAHRLECHIHKCEESVFKSLVWEGWYYQTWWSRHGSSDGVLSGALSDGNGLGFSALLPSTEEGCLQYDFSPL
jgi:hypothetical protein